MEALEINTAIQIQRAQQEIFEAIIDPQKMANYFIAEGSAPMEKGKSVEWKFPEFEERVPVKVLEVQPYNRVSFEWEGAKAKMLKVEIILTEIAKNDTLVKISEGKMENDKAGIQWLKSNTEGWANFLACLKAYVEHDINLRNGAFDFMKK